MCGIRIGVLAASVFNSILRTAKNISGKLDCWVRVAGKATLLVSSQGFFYLFNITGCGSLSKKYYLL